MDVKEQDKLTEAQVQELTEKSWNLELIISGAAIFMTTLIPDAVDWLLRYYIEELAPKGSYENHIFPLLAYSFFKVMAWMLTFFFVCHFAMRAFWASLIGLHAAFPEGIKYENLPNFTQTMRDIVKKDFGQLESYIIKVDKFTNQLFAFAFSVIFFGLAIGILYLMFMAVSLLAQNFLGETGKTIVLYIFGYGFSALAIGVLLSTEWMKKNPEAAQKYQTTHAKISLAFSSLLPFFRRPSQYLLLTFSSNIPPKRYYAALGIMFIVVFIPVIGVFLGKTEQIRERHLNVSRSYFSAGSAQFEIYPRNYDNTRHQNDLFPPVSLPSEIIEDDFVKLFVAIPKSLDNEISRTCTLPELPDSIPRKVRIRQLDSLRIDCLTRFFKVTLNDTAAVSPQWYFHVKPESGTKGIIAYLPFEKQAPGAYHITVEKPHEEKRDSLVVWGQIPFWYTPK